MLDSIFRYEKMKPTPMSREALAYIKQFIPEDVTNLEVKF